MADYTTFNPATGAVTGKGNCADEIVDFVQEQATTGLVWGVQLDEATHHIDLATGQPAERVPLPIAISQTRIKADDVDEAVLTGFPEDAIVTIDDGQYEITGGEIVITSPMPANYHLSCTHWPYLDWEATVEAVA